MLEILAPAGSPESVVAAVQNGADAVYMGFGDFNARKNAKNFTQNEFAKAVEYCRVRGVVTYVTLNTLVTDREFDKAVAHARAACRMGADGIIVQDWGLMQAIRQAVPEMRITASTQMSVHNLEGVKMAAAMEPTGWFLPGSCPWKRLGRSVPSRPLRSRSSATARCACAIPASAR